MNILIAEDGCAVVSDFEVSRLLEYNGKIPGTNTLKANTRWTARELLGPANEKSGDRVHTKASDVWAFGMVVYVRRVTCIFDTASCGLIYDIGSAVSKITILQSRQ